MQMPAAQPQVTIVSQQQQQPTGAPPAYPPRTYYIISYVCSAVKWS